MGARGGTLSEGAQPGRDGHRGTMRITGEQQVVRKTNVAMAKRGSSQAWTEQILGFYSMGICNWLFEGILCDT